MLKISVVIPTYRRPQLVCEAVASARSQDLAPHEIVVVLDGPDAETTNALESIHGPDLKVVTLPHKAGAALARNQGVETASGTHIAFLDDDDRWEPNHLSSRLRTLTALDALDRFSFGGILTRTDHGEVRRPILHYTTGTPIGDYLFVHRRLLGGGGVTATTSTYLAPRALLLQHPFDPSMRFHQDWDLLLRLDSESVPIVFAPDYTAHVLSHLTRLSISSNTPWQDSLCWLHDHRHLLTPEAYSGFASTTIAYRCFGQAQAFLPLWKAIRRGNPCFADYARLVLQIWLPPPVRRAVHRVRHLFTRITSS